MKRPTKTAPLWCIVLIAPMVFIEWVTNAVEQWPPRLQGFMGGILFTVTGFLVLCVMAMWSY